MNYLVVSVDPGVSEGATVIMDDIQQIYFVSKWKTASDAHKYYECAEAAKQTCNEIGSGRIDKFYPSLTPVVLIHEDVYVPVRVRKRTTGFLPGLEKEEQIYSPTAAFELCKSIGIWTCCFSGKVYSVHVARWRTHAGINQYYGSKECKRLSVEHAKLLLKSSVVTDIDGSQIEIDDHMADAYLIGRYWTDMARLAIAAGIDPLVHGVETVER